MNVVDSSGWLEYFADGSNANFFALPQLLKHDLSKIARPSTRSGRTVHIKPFVRAHDRPFVASPEFIEGSNHERQFWVNPNCGCITWGKYVDTTIALSAARISLELKLPMADSVMLATARAYNATFWTQDSDFKDVKGVRYIEKK